MTILFMLYLFFMFIHQIDVNIEFNKNETNCIIKPIMQLSWMGTTKLEDLISKVNFI